MPGVQVHQQYQNLSSFGKDKIVAYRHIGLILLQCMNAGCEAKKTEEHEEDQIVNLHDRRRLE